MTSLSSSKNLWNTIFSKLIFKKQAALKINPSAVSPVTFLEEVPFKQPKGLKFGHIQLVASLRQIIIASRASMTIGLFGNWGSGKSSIVEQSKIELQDHHIPLVIFDVWKHDGDALRRTFLKELDMQLSSFPYGERYVKNKNALDPRVYNSVVISSEKISIKWGRLFFNALMVLLISTIVIGPVFGVLLLIQSLFQSPLLSLFAESKWGLGLTQLLSTIFTGGLIYKYADTFIKVEKKEDKKEKLLDPHEFELEFDKLINNLKPEIKTIVIAFDNLDRIPGENALKVISTIKTFLDFKSEKSDCKVIFLIPCDVNAIKAHIQKTTLPDNPVYVDEFLRKFFNTNIWIPDFFENELEEFAAEQLEKTGIPEFKNEILAWLIIRVFNKNPRQIIQFVNILVANYIVLRQSCEDKNFEDKNFYKNNIPQLAKYLLLKQKFPAIMDHLLENSIFHIDDEILSDEKTFEHQRQAYAAFLSKTREIQIQSFEPFFKGRLSKAEIAIPGISSLLDRIAIGSDNLEFPEEFLVANSLSPLSDAIRNRFNGINNTIAKLKYIDGCLIFSEKLGIDFTPNVYRDFLNAIIQHLHPEYFIIDPIILSEQLLQKMPNPIFEHITKLIGFYIVRLNLKGTVPEDLALRILDFLVKYESYFSPEQLLVFQRNISGFIDVPAFAEKLVQNNAIYQKFITGSHYLSVLDKLEHEADFKHSLKLLEVLGMFNTREDYELRTLEILAKSFGSIVASRNQDEVEAVVARYLGILDCFRGSEFLKTAETFHPFFNFCEPRQDLWISLLPMIPFFLGEAGTRENAAKIGGRFFQHTTLENIKDLEKRNINLNDLLEERSLYLLAHRTSEVKQINLMISRLLNPENKIKYIGFLLKAKASEPLNELSQDLLKLHNQHTATICELIFDNIKPNDEVAEDLFNTFSWTLRFLRQQIPKGLVSKQHIDFLISWIDIQHNDIRSLCINELALFDEQKIEQDYLVRKLINCAYANTLSTFSSIYKIVFGNIDKLNRSQKNKLRDLTYHLLNNLNDDHFRLNLGIYVTNFESNFDLADIYPAVKDVVDNIQPFNGSEKWKLYKAILKNIEKSIKSKTIIIFDPVLKKIDTLIGD